MALLDAGADDYVTKPLAVGELLACVRLTPTEYRLLVALARHPGRVLTHAQLLRDVWGAGHPQAHHYVRVYMAQLRGKLEVDPSRPALLLTEPGVGYRTRDP